MSGDLISRQDAIEAIMGLPTWWADDGGYYGGAQPPMEALLDPKDVVSAIENLPSAKSERKWIPVSERLPIDGSLVIACSPYGGITIVYFRKGLSQADRTKMKNGEIDDPSEETWCLSEGYSKSKRSDLFKEEDEWGNNQKAYAWKYGPFHYSGQDFVAWMPLPKPWKGE